MSIEEGEIGRASDFIDTSSGAGDAGKGVKLNASGKISKTMTPDHSVYQIASSATPSIDVDLYNMLEITAQEVDITSMSSGLSGTPVNGQILDMKITVAQKNPNFAFVATSSTNNSASTITVAKPTGTVDNDIMFAEIYCQGGQPTTVPSGWILLGTKQISIGWLNVYFKVASSEGASYIWGTSGSTTWDGTINTYRGGFNISNPVSFETFVNTTYNTNNTTVRAASTNVIKQNSPLIFFGLATGGKTFTPPTGFTEDSEYTSNHTSTIASKVWTSYGATGNIDATLSASASTDKHAMLVALNPEINITWGSSFAQVGDALPTTLFYPGIINIDFVYNSTTSKWETRGENNNTRQRRHYCGAFTKDLSEASTALIVAHGLAGTPKKIKFTAIFNSTTVTNRCDGVYTPDIQYEQHYGTEDGSSATSMASNTGVAFIITNDANFTANQSAVVSAINNNNFTITFTKNSSPSGTAHIFWEAEV